MPYYVCFVLSNFAITSLREEGTGHLAGRLDLCPGCERSYLFSLPVFGTDDTPGHFNYFWFGICGIT